MEEARYRLHDRPPAERTEGVRLLKRKEKRMTLEERERMADRRIAEYYRIQAESDHLAKTEGFTAAWEYVQREYAKKQSPEGLKA